MRLEVAEAQRTQSPGRGLQRAATQKTKPVGRVLRAAQPRPEDERNEQIFMTRGREERADARVAGVHVRQFAAYGKRQLVLVEVTQPFARDENPIRFAEPERRHRCEQVLADEDQRLGHPKQSAATAHDAQDVGKLSLRHAQAGAQQASSGDRDVDHCDDEQNANFRDGKG